MLCFGKKLYLLTFAGKKCIARIRPERSETGRQDLHAFTLRRFIPDDRSAALSGYAQ